MAKSQKETPDSTLAIFGAPPAFLEPLHVGRPNVGNQKELLRRIRSVIDSRWFTNHGPMVQEFEREAARYLGGNDFFENWIRTLRRHVANSAGGLYVQAAV